MALARLALRNISRRVGSGTGTSSPLVGSVVGERQRWNNELLKRFMATNTNTAETSSVAVTEADSSKPKLFSRKKGKRGGLWRTNQKNMVPQFYELFPSGLGNALMQATENINRLFENINIIGRLKEKDECYKLRYEVPGLSKEDLKITIDDGVLSIRGESKEERDEESDDEYWSMKSYGYYNTSLLLPDDAKADEIKAELKNGVLHITIPKTHPSKTDSKEIPIH